MKPCDGSFCACSCHAGTLPLDWQGPMESAGATAPPEMPRVRLDPVAVAVIRDLERVNASLLEALARLVGWHDVEPFGAPGPPDFPLEGRVLMHSFALREILAQARAAIVQAKGQSEVYRGYDSGGPDRPSFGVEIDMQIDDPRTRYATIQKLINGRTAWAVEALERINELATVDRGEYSHDQFVRILSVAREAIRRAAGTP